MVWSRCRHGVLVGFRVGAGMVCLRSGDVKVVGVGVDVGMVCMRSGFNYAISQAIIDDYNKIKLFCSLNHVKHSITPYYIRHAFFRNLRILLHPTTYNCVMDLLFCKLWQLPLVLVFFTQFNCSFDIINTRNNTMQPPTMFVAIFAFSSSTK